MSKAREREPRGGDRVLVGTKRGCVVRCERSHDKGPKRGRRTYLVRFDDQTEARFSRAAIVVL